MKTKILLSMVFASLFLALTLVQALSLTANPASMTFNTDGSSKSLTLTGNEVFNITSFNSSLIISDGAGHSSTITITNTSAINNVTSATFSVFASNFSDFEFGTYSSNLIIKAIGALNSSVNDTETISISLNKAYNICGSSDVANVDTQISDINVVSGFGEDEDYWYPLDKVEIEVEVSNNGDYDVKNIEIRACLWDTNAEECVMDGGDMDISEDDFDLDSDDDQTTILTIEIDPENLNSGNNNYILYVSAIGEIDASSSDPKDGDETCSSDSENAEIRTDEDFIILNKIEIPEETSCGDILSLNGEAWNVGENDLDDIYAVIYNKELGLNEKVDIGNINAFDKEDLSFEFKVPNNATEKTYTIEIKVYDEDDDLFELDNDDEDESIFNYPLKVQNCVRTPATTVSITAELSDETPSALIGSQVIIEATIKNTGTATASYNLDVSGNSAWSKTSEIDPKTFSLTAGESKKVLIYLDVDKTAEEGEKEFTIKATSAGVITEQKVKLTLEKGFTGTSLMNHFKENWFIYVIVLVNIILIIAIIIVVKSLLTRKS